MLGRGRDEQKEAYARGRPLIAGETAISGNYRCPQCGHQIEIEEGRITNLPVCPRCLNDTWHVAGD